MSESSTGSTTDAPYPYSCEDRDDHEAHLWEGQMIPDDTIPGERGSEFRDLACPGQPIWCSRCGVQILTAGTLGWFKYIDDDSSGWLCAFEDPKFHLREKHTPIGPASKTEVEEATRSILRAAP